MRQRQLRRDDDLRPAGQSRIGPVTARTTAATRRAVVAGPARGPRAPPRPAAVPATAGLRTGGDRTASRTRCARAPPTLVGTRTPALTHQLRMRHTCSNTCVASEPDVSTPGAVCEGVGSGGEPAQLRHGSAPRPLRYCDHVAPLQTITRANPSPSQTIISAHRGPRSNDHQSTPRRPLPTIPGAHPDRPDRPRSRDHQDLTAW